MIPKTFFSISFIKIYFVKKKKKDKIVEKAKSKYQKKITVLKK